MYFDRVFIFFAISGAFVLLYNKNSAFLLVILFFPLILTTSPFAATVTWDGGGTDSKWSTIANWSGDALPATSDDVVFDATSVDPCSLGKSPSCPLDARRKLG